MSESLLSDPEEELAVAGVAPQSIRTRALRVAMWASAGRAFSLVLQAATNVVLARLLSPEAFGIVALCQVVVRGLSMFSEVGVQPAIVHSQRGDAPEFVNTAWTIQSIRGVLLFLATCLLAVPAARFYEQPMITGILPLLGVGSLIGGLNSTRSATLSRHLLEGPQTKLFIVSGVITKTAMIAWAFIHPSAWAIAGGTVLGGVAHTLGTHLYLPGLRNRLYWHHESARSLMSFGKWIFLGTVIAFFGQQIDRLLLGKLEVMAVLGVYAIGMSLIRMPEEAIGAISTALFPAIATVVRSDRSAFERKYRQARQLILPTAMALVLCAVVGAPVFFGMLYSSAYGEAALIAQLGALCVWFGMLAASHHQALMALGRTRALAVSGIWHLAGASAGAVAGYWVAGVPGFVLGTAAGPACRWAWMQVALVSEGASFWVGDLGFTGMLLGATLFVTIGPGLFLTSGTAIVVVQCTICMGVLAWAARRVLAGVRGNQ